MDISKTAIVTGSTGAIGKAIVRQLALKSYKVIMIGRDLSKTESTLREITREVGIAKLTYEIVDLSRFSGVKSLANKIQEPIDVLINNAAITPQSRELSSDGIEMQFAVNVLNYFWMSLAFRDHLKKAAPSRIVNVASHYAGGLDLHDLQFIKRRYNNDAAYRQSKQADRMITVALAERFLEDGIAVNSCHPGGVNSKLSNSMGFGGHETPDQGAATPVWLATSDDGINNTGKWFDHLRESHCEFSRDKAAINTLYEICLKFSPGLEK